MVHVSDLAYGFLTVSGLISLALAMVSIVAYRRSRNGSLAFVVAAFLVFSLKSFVIAYSLYAGLIEHELLELLDAVGDMTVVLLFVLPLVWPTRAKP